MIAKPSGLLHGQWSCHRFEMEAHDSRGKSYIPAGG
jgi:hypothetical protein